MWINACGFMSKDISYVCDSTPGKQYTFVPGTNIPVLSEGMLTADMPDYAIMFCWNFRNDVIDKEAYFKTHGGKWIVPVPAVEAV